MALFSEITTGGSSVRQSGPRVPLVIFFGRRVVFGDVGRLAWNGVGTADPFAQIYIGAAL